MAGTLISLLDRTDYAFTNLATSTTTGLIPVVQNVDVSMWREVTLLVRVHTRDMGSTGQKLAVSIVPVLPSSEEPDAYFRAAEVASVEIDENSGQGVLLRDAASPNTGAMVTLMVRGTQGSGAGAVAATISVALSCKS